MKTILASAVLAASLSGLAGVATAKDMQSGQVTFCGQVISLDDGRCIAVKNADGSGTAYVVNAALPRPREGMTISGTGKILMMGKRCDATAALSDIIYKVVDVCALGH